MVSMLLQSTAGVARLASRAATACGIGYLYLQTGFRKQREFLWLYDNLLQNLHVDYKYRLLAKAEYAKLH